MKILLDMNLSPDWVGFLRAEGFEALHWRDVGDPGASDAEIMAWASLNSCVVFTHDLDFSALLAATRASGPSVIQVRTQDTLPDAIGRDVVRVLHLRREDLMTGALVVIDKLKSRVRLLHVGAGRTR